ncbi:hypothetical protein LR48_Vigan02g103000 [Vigna angularis]|uniref:Uncharacterized protein n=1 Tax=Phaseolus angularis TaxID=3914 RepID=A0A0L9TWF4_PHAAN|nr:hypothetical protein LR48_Vigan02g103000 [Vigna angularis]
MKQKSDNRLPLSEGGDPPPPPLPPPWHEKWKLAHLRSSGSYTSDSVREISERIDSLVEQSFQGIKQFFRSSSRPSSYGFSKEYEQRLKQDITKEITMEITKKVRAYLYDEVTEMLMRQFQQQFKSYCMRPQPSLVAEHVVLPTSRSNKGSSSAPGVPGDNMDDTRPCQLYVVHVTETMLVARGTVFEAATIVHGMELGEDQQTNREGSPTLKKIHLSENDPLGALHELSNISADAPMIVS